MDGWMDGARRLRAVYVRACHDKKAAHKQQSLTDLDVARLDLREGLGLPDIGQQPEIQEGKVGRLEPPAEAEEVGHFLERVHWRASGVSK